MKNKFLKWYLVGFLLILTNKLIGNSEIIFSFLGKLKEMLSPFIFGIIIAFILSGVMKKIEKNFNLKRGVAFLSTYLMFFVILIFSLLTIFPLIIGNIIDLTNKIPNYTYEFQNILTSNAKNIKWIELLKINKFIISNIGEISTWLGKILNIILGFVISSIISFSAGITKFVMGLIISMYVVYDIEGFQNKMSRNIRGLLGKENSIKMYEIFELCRDTFKKFFIGQLIDAIAVGVISFIGLSIIGVPYAILLSLIIAIFNMIPYLGPILGGIPVVVVAFLDSPQKALFSIVFILILQQIEGNILAPRILGNSVGISSFSILLAITLGGGFFGILGMFLAVPIFKIILVLFENFIDKRL